MYQMKSGGKSPKVGPVKPGMIKPSTAPGAIKPSMKMGGSCGTPKSLRNGNVK